MPQELDQDARLVVDFCNTLDVEDGTDVLDSPTEYGSWLAERDLSTSTPTKAQIDAARQLRSVLRAAVTHDDAADGGRDMDVDVNVRISADGAVDVGASDPVGGIAAAVARLAIEGRFPRVKICPADDCRWAFYDRSRNASGRWCSMQVCGNRAKVRASRARARRS